MSVTLIKLKSGSVFHLHQEPQRMKFHPAFYIIWLQSEMTLAQTCNLTYISFCAQFILFSESSTRRLHSADMVPSNACKVLEENRNLPDRTGYKTDYLDFPLWYSYFM